LTLPGRPTGGRIGIPGFAGCGSKVSRSPRALQAQWPPRDVSASPRARLGLLQLMPGPTAAASGKPRLPAPSKLQQQPLMPADGSAAILAELLRLWQGNPFWRFAVTTRSRGPLQGWLSPSCKREPELWVRGQFPSPARHYNQKGAGQSLDLPSSLMGFALAPAPKPAPKDAKNRPARPRASRRRSGAWRQDRRPATISIRVRFKPATAPTWPESACRAAHFSRSQ